MIRLYLNIEELDNGWLVQADHLSVKVFCKDFDEVQKIVQKSLKTFQENELGDV